MRINKFIAKSGITSRRKADELIKNGLVKVNGQRISEPGLDIKDSDQVEVNGQVIGIEEKFYIKVYKPVGFITSNYDPHNDKDLNYLVKVDKKFFAAGRLDKDSEGLLIVTNDGDFTNMIIHPRQKLDKEYIVKVDKKLSKKEEDLFQRGIDIGRGEITSDAKIKLLDPKKNTYRVIIHQGFNRQIRRMFGYFNVNVLSLKRIRIGEIKLSDMKPYDNRYFDEGELSFVKKVKG